MTSTSRPAARPSWIGVLLAPVWGILCPRVAGAYVVVAPTAAAAISLVFWLLVYGCVWVFLFLCHEVALWKPESAACTWSTALAGTWRDYHIAALGGWLGWLEVLALITMGLGLLAVMLLAWLHLPFVHRTGPVWPSYARALRASALVLSPLTVATLVCGAVFVVSKQERNRYNGPPWWATSALGVEPGILLFFGIAGSLCILTYWLHRTMSGAAQTAPELSLPPRCEECGYDLTHQPAGGRCSECGGPLEASLDMERSRPGSVSARKRTARGWWMTSHDVLFRPAAFYRRLRLRTRICAEAGFAGWHYVWLAGGGAVWGGAMLVSLAVQHSGPPAGEERNVALALCGLVLSGVFGCWLGQRRSRLW